MPIAPLQRSKTPLTKECPGYNTEQTDGEFSVLEP